MEGYSSAFNFYPISNAIGSDHWPELWAALDAHKEIVEQVVKEKRIMLVDTGEMISCDLFMTGDMAFLLSMLGLNPAASTYGNPWVYHVPSEEDENKKVFVWRKADDYYLHGHVLPPRESNFWKQNQDDLWPWICDCCGDASGEKRRTRTRTTTQADAPNCRQR